MEAEFCPKQQVTILSTPNGLVLSAGNGAFFVRTTVADRCHEVDPVGLLGLSPADVELLAPSGGEHLG